MQLSDTGSEKETDMGGRGTAGGKREIPVSRTQASEDWFEYESANLMAEYIRTGKMPKEDMNGQRLSKEDRERLMQEAELIQQEASTKNTKQNTLYRGLVMSEEDARALTPGQTYTLPTISAATPDRKLAGVYSDVENYGGGEGVPVIFTIQKSGGINGFKRDSMETVLPKGDSYRVVRNYMDENGVVHIDLYAKKKKRKSKR